MRTAHILGMVVLVFVLAVTACSPPGTPVLEEVHKTDTPPAAATDTQTPAFTPTAEPSSTPSPEPFPSATPEPSLTATPALSPLEIQEWAIYPYANLADPQVTDQRVEMLVRNPNDFPVRVNTSDAEIRFLNAAGEVVYRNPSPTFYIWEGSWILGGETVPISVCECFDTDGVARQAWELLELFAPLEAASNIVYTNDVEVNLGEFFSLSEAHLGGDEMGVEIKLVNTSDQVLKRFEVHVTARDANSKYVGVAISGSFADRDNAGNYTDIAPGASGGGVVVSLIDYVDGPLNYEVTAIGIPAD